MIWRVSRIGATVIATLAIFALLSGARPLAVTLVAVADRLALTAAALLGAALTRSPARHDPGHPGRSQRPLTRTGGPEGPPVVRHLERRRALRVVGAARLRRVGRR